MLGLQDPWVATAYVLCLASSALCVIYGAMHWNDGEEANGEDKQHWAEEENRIGEEF